MIDSRLARALDTSAFGDVASMTMEELRACRAECQELEVGLSYQRRMAQGRLDIVDAERRRRATGAALVDPGDLVSSLSDILADRGRTPGTGRLPQLMSPDAAGVDTTTLDAIVGPARLASLSDVDASELDRLVDAIADHEVEVSAGRRSLHERIDALQAEITQRYRTGEASVESLLH